MQIKDVTKKYNGKPVVDAVNLEIPKGKVISFIGPNGAGKSTVMGIISRLIAKDSGLVSFDGTELEKWKSKELSKRMVIAQDTDYILLDEPTNNLDIYHATNMMKIVRRLCDELEKTIILVLHEINYAAFYSDYICAFVDGKVAKFGTVKEVMTKETLSEIYKVDFEILEIEGKPLSIYY